MPRGRSAQTSEHLAELPTDGSRWAPSAIGPEAANDEIPYEDGEEITDDAEGYNDWQEPQGTQESERDILVLRQHPQHRGPEGRLDNVDLNINDPLVTSHSDVKVKKLSNNRSRGCSQRDSQDSPLWPSVPSRCGGGVGGAVGRVG